MKNLLFVLLALLSFCFIGCQSEDIEKADSPAKNAREAQARLAQKEWIIDGILFNGQEVYKRGADKEMDKQLGIDWYKFHPDGLFEVKYTNESETEKSRYVVNEAANTITFTWDDTDFGKVDCKIEAGSVYNDHFAMSFVEEYQGQKDEVTLKMVVK